MAQLKAILDPFLQSLPQYTWEHLGVWYDAVDIRHPGAVELDPDNKNGVRRRDLADQILDGLSQCQFTLAMVSPRYMQSGWCRFEWRHSRTDHPGILTSCWKKTTYLRNYATWTDPYRNKRLWVPLYALKPLKAVETLLREVVRYARIAG